MKSLKNRGSFCILYALLWIAYFLFARAIFLIFYFNKTKDLDFLTIIKTFFYGFSLDSSFTAYLCFVPFFLLIFSAFFSSKIIATIIKYYTAIVLLFLNLMLIIDSNLYGYWGIRIDNTFLKYLNTPKAMIASSSVFQIFFGIVLWVMFSVLFIKLFHKLSVITIEKIEKRFWTQSLLFFMITAFLIIPARGGLQTIPVNQSNVYFSSNMFANHASINFIWNFFDALYKSTDDHNPYKFFDDNTAQKIINKRKNKLVESDNYHILNTSKPNVILIIWESLTYKLVGSLGGEPNVTVNLNKLSKEGILFTNFYANGDRTDKGIPAIFSGYYPQPTKSIMKSPSKTRSLPMLPSKMINIGYDTSFYYGGDLSFGNMNTYLRNAGINSFIDGGYFDKKNWNSKWGVHDHVLFKHFSKNLKYKQKSPFFKIILTLTSHEPFEIIGEYKFGKDTEENKFRSAHAYTDKIIGDFINFAKQQEWYKNTLIIITSDHGHQHPKHKGHYNSPKKFKIPMLWLGGALNKKGIKINNISTQIDLPFTLLDLLNEDNKDFVFSKNIFNNSDEQYAHYIFNKGFGILTEKEVFVFDFTNNNPIISEGENVLQIDSLGKAISQNAYNDFLERK